MNKIYHYEYLWSGGYGAYTEHDCIVVADSEETALKMALLEYPDTDTTADCWHARKISADIPVVYHIFSRSN